MQVSELRDLNPLRVLAKAIREDGWKVPDFLYTHLSIGTIRRSPWSNYQRVLGSGVSPRDQRKDWAYNPLLVSTTSATSSIREETKHTPWRKEVKYQAGFVNSMEVTEAAVSCPPN
jgi:hypothetical protein